MQRFSKITLKGHIWALELSWFMKKYRSELFNWIYVWRDINPLIPGEETARDFETRSNRAGATQPIVNKDNGAASERRAYCGQRSYVFSNRKAHHPTPWTYHKIIKMDGWGWGTNRRSSSNRELRDGEELSILRQPMRGGCPPPQPEVSVIS